MEQNDLDAVLIATPDHWHSIPTILACKAGKDVYVEKPLAYSIKEGRAMVDAARQNRRVVQVGMQHRSAPGTQPKEEIGNDPEASALLFRQPRKPWDEMLRA